MKDGHEGEEEEMGRGRETGRSIGDTKSIPEGGKGRVKYLRLP